MIIDSSAYYIFIANLGPAWNAGYSESCATADPRIHRNWDCHNTRIKSWTSR